MKIIKVSLKNWKIFRGEQAIEFASGDANITLLFGENMHGKTSLMNALRWGLYGKTVDHLGNVIGEKELINKIAYQDGEREFSVEITMESDEQVYKLTRSTNLEVAGSSNSVALQVENERYDDQASIENQINNLIPEQIARFFLFDGELLSEFERLVKAAGTVQARGIKAAIEKNLGIPILARGVEELSELSKEFDKKHAQEAANQKQNKLLVEKFKETERKLSKQIETSTKLQTLITDGEKHIEQLRSTLAKDQDALRHIEREKHIQYQLKKNKENISEIKIELKGLTKDVWMVPLKEALKPKVKQLNQQLDDLKTLKQKALEATIQVIKLKKSLQGDICEFCNQPISPDSRKTIEREVHTLELLALEGDTSEAEFEIQTRLKALNFLENAVDDTKQIQSLAKILNSKQKENTSYEQQLLEITEILSGIDREKSEVTANEYEMRVAEVAENKQRLETIEGEIEMIEKDLNAQRSKLNVNEAKAGQKDAKTAAELTAQLKVAFKQTVTNYRDVMKEKIEKRAAETFRNITTEKQFDELKINENYGLDLIVDKQIVPRSAGAEQIVAMSLIEAINHLGRRKGPMFMDTPAGRLDLEHREKIMNYLPSAVTQLALFAHSGELSEDNIYFDTVKVGKKYRLVRKDTFHTELVEVN